MRAAWLGAAMLTAACGGSGTPAVDRPNVLLVTIDTLRADHLSCYGYERPTSPHLDALAAEGWRCTHVQSPRAKTTPAIASLLSGLYPHDHGVRDLSGPLRAPVPLLQEVLGRAGYRTAGLVGNFVLTDARSGLARGFDHWEDTLPDLRGVPPHAAPQRTASSLTDGALTWLAEPSDRPWFLWLHYMDPHGAYEPPAEHRSFEGGPPVLLPLESELPASTLHHYRIAEYNVPADARTPEGRVDTEVVRARYDGEIHYADAELGRLLDHLRETGVLEHTLVVVTADHGESLGEHRYWYEHGVYAYQATCRVPLIVRPPAALRATPGVRAGDLSLVDVAPTVLELVGLPPRLGGEEDRAGSLRGRSRAGLLLRDESAGPPVFSEKVERAELDGAVQIKAVRIGDWKLIRRYAHRPERNPGEGRELVALSDELYDLESDPAEAHDLSQSPPAGAPVAELRAALLDFAAADVHFAELADILQQRREALERDDAEALRTLKALGY